MDRLEQMFPPFGLRLSCGPLTMRSFREADLPALRDAIVAAGIYNDGRAFPFLTRWPELMGEHGLASMQYYWRLWSVWTPQKWHLPLAVERDGRVIGAQDLLTNPGYPAVRSFETGSWLLRTEQGRGYGTLMRQMIAALAFDHLGAIELTSGAFAGNERSWGVSRRVGYVPNGVTLMPSVDGVGVRELYRTRLLPDAFVRAAEEVRYEGLDEFLAFVAVPAD